MIADLDAAVDGFFDCTANPHLVRLGIFYQLKDRSPDCLGQRRPRIDDALQIGRKVRCLARYRVGNCGPDTKAWCSDQS
jgi:hypothetical protein